jgi:hypothetical protein
MKTIRLNRRYKLYKEHGYQVGLKFTDYYTKAGQAKVQAVETACRKMFSNSGWFPGTSDWTGYRQPARVDRPATYFIMFRRESDMTMALLKAQV